MYCKLVINKIDNGRVINVNVNQLKEPLQIMRQLATCYRESNPKTAKNERIKKSKAWETLSESGGVVQKFRFEIIYNEDNHYIYEYEFTGCGLD